MQEVYAKQSVIGNFLLLLTPSQARNSVGESWHIRVLGFMAMREQIAIVF